MHYHAKELCKVHTATRPRIMHNMGHTPSISADLGPHYPAWKSLRRDGNRCAPSKIKLKTTMHVFAALPESSDGRPGCVTG